MTVNTQELRELVEKATPGPWFHGAKNGEHKYCVYDKVCWTDDDGRHGETPNMVVHVSPDDGKYHDAAYIAAANPATVSALLDEIDALRALVAELAENDTYETEYDGRMYSICHGCGAQDGEDHRRADCVYVRAQAALNPPAPPQGDGAC